MIPFEPFFLAFTGIFVSGIVYDFNSKQRLKTEIERVVKLHPKDGKYLLAVFIFWSALYIGGLIKLTY